MIDHEHCPLGCYHPQPFEGTPTPEQAREHGLEEHEQSFCGRCWFVDKILTPMVPCAPPYCEETEGMERPRFETIYMKMALLLRERSTCHRLQVGCVIASEDFRKVLAVGYNGNASGLPNQCDGTEPGKCGCLHGEENAIINCDSPRYGPKIVFCTNLPCPMCAKRLINLGGVQQVYYHDDYRLKEGLEVLTMAGIRHERLQV